MNSIRKDTGTIARPRVQIKAFKHSEDMYKFLNRQHDNSWYVMRNPVKSGTYIERGNELLNVKSIDPSALAHM